MGIAAATRRGSGGIDAGRISVTTSCEWPIMEEPYAITAKKEANACGVEAPAILTAPRSHLIAQAALDQKTPQQR